MWKVLFKKWLAGMLRKQLGEARGVRRFAEYLLPAIKFAAPLREALPTVVFIGGEEVELDEEKLREYILLGSHGEMTAISNVLREKLGEGLGLSIDIDFEALRDALHKIVGEMTYEEASDPGTVEELLRLLNKLVKVVGGGLNEGTVGLQLCDALLSKFGEEGLSLAEKVWLPALRGINPDMAAGFRNHLEDEKYAMLGEGKVVPTIEQVLASLKEDWQSFLTEWKDEDIADIDVEAGGYTLDVISDETHELHIIPFVKFSVETGRFKEFVDTLREFIASEVEGVEGEEKKQQIFKRAVAESLLLAVDYLRMSGVDVSEVLDEAKAFAAEMGLKPEFSVVLRKMLIMQAVKEVLLKQLLGDW